MKDGCPAQKPIIIQMANIEAELLDLQQDIALKSVYQSQSTVEFWKQVSIDKYTALIESSHCQQWSSGNRFLLTDILHCDKPVTVNSGVLETGFC